FAYKAAIARMQKSFTMHQLLGQTRRPEGNSAVTFANALNRFAEVGYIGLVRRGRGGRDRVVLPGNAIADLAVLERRLADSRRIADPNRLLIPQRVGQRELEPSSVPA
ncbi:MAG: hypothetical protein ABIR79_15990, partial [Candidatus Binatia bacterium]